MLSDISIERRASYIETKLKFLTKVKFRPIPDLTGEYIVFSPIQSSPSILGRARIMRLYISHQTPLSALTAGGLEEAWLDYRALA